MGKPVALGWIKFTRGEKGQDSHLYVLVKSSLNSHWGWDRGEWKMKLTVLLFLGVLSS